MSKKKPGASAGEAEDKRELQRQMEEARARMSETVAELSGFADVVLPTISAKVKELFGLDLDAYLRAARAEEPARKSLPRKRAPAAKAKGKSKKAKGKS